MMLAIPALADFELNIGSEFLLFLPQESAPAILRLDRIQDRSVAPYENFSLMFSGFLETVWPHDTYRISHPGLGDFLLFLGPVMGGGAGEVRYQAVVSRLQQPA